MSCRIGLKVFKILYCALRLHDSVLYPCGVERHASKIEGPGDGSRCNLAFFTKYAEECLKVGKSTLLRTERMSYYYGNVRSVSLSLINRRTRPVEQLVAK